MANGAVLNNEMAPLKTVHEMSLAGDEPSPGYIVKEGKFGLVDSSPPSAPIPTIDISLLSSDEELEKLRSALVNSWGYFQVSKLSWQVLQIFNACLYAYVEGGLL